MTHKADAEEFYEDPVQNFLPRDSSDRCRPPTGRPPTHAGGAGIEVFAKGNPSDEKARLRAGPEKPESRL